MKEATLELLEIKSYEFGLSKNAIVNKSLKEFLMQKPFCHIKKKNMTRKGQWDKENKTQLFKIDGGLLMFLPFFMKKGQIVKILSQDES